MMGSACHGGSKGRGNRVACPEATQSFPLALGELKTSKFTPPACLSVCLIYSDNLVSAVQDRIYMASYWVTYASWLAYLVVQKNKKANAQRLTHKLKIFLWYEQLK